MAILRKASWWMILFVVLGMVTTLMTAPRSVRAADHLDAPGLASPGGIGELDVNDVYVMEGADPANTVLALTVNPAATGDTKFATRKEGAYFIRIDNDGDAKEDITYSITFKTKNDGTQRVVVQKGKGRKAQANYPRGRRIARGNVGDVRNLRGGGTFLAELRSDPFFFDLAGFLGTVEGAANGRMLNDGSESDFFDGLNTLAIVLEVPDDELGDGPIGVWATTSVKSSGKWSQNDRIGRPAINTAVNSSGPIVGAPSANKDVFNAGRPKNDVANFTGAAVDALLAYSSLGTQYTVGEAEAIAAILLPDILTYDTSTAASYAMLNGRALPDDVMDISLGLVSNGAVTGDGVGAHTDYLSVFPYLGEAH